jgi:hypothetical protein
MTAATTLPFGRPLTRADLETRDRFQAAGAASYWLCDPDELSVTILEVRNGEYVEVARAVGDEALEVTLPFPVRIVPSALLD